MGKLLPLVTGLTVLLLLTGCSTSAGNSNSSSYHACGDQGALQGPLASAPAGLVQAADVVAMMLVAYDNVPSSDVDCALLLALAQHATNFGQQQSGHATSGCGVPDSVVKEVDTSKLEPGGPTMTELGIKNEPRTICDWVDTQGNFGFLHYPKGSWETDAAGAQKQMPEMFGAPHADPYDADESMMVAAQALFTAEKGGQSRQAALQAWLGGDQNAASSVLDVVSKSGYETGGPTGGGPAGGAGSNAACATAGNCSPQGFADAILTYPGVNAPVTPANESALETWERAEGGNWNNGASGNPLNTTQREPGSTSINSVGVQAFHDTGGHTYWWWGIKANGDTLQNGNYPPILSALRSPAGDAHGQCVKLAGAVGSTPWGTGNFSQDC